MRVTLITADSAQRDSVGKVHALGLNWTWLSVPTPPVAVVVLIEPEKEYELMESVKLKVELIDSDDAPVLFGEPKVPLHALIQAVAEQPRAPLMLAFNVGPNLPLEPGRYSWRAVDKSGKEYARVAFDIRPGSDLGEW